MAALYWNCASGFLKKWDCIKGIITDESPDIFFVAEADLAKGFDLSLFNLSEYSLELNSTYHSRGKCRLIAFHKGGYKRVLDLEEDGNELIVLYNGRQAVVGLYRHFKCFENETLVSNFDRLMNNLSSVVRHFASDTTTSILIMGDLNVDLMGVETRFTSKFRDWIDGFVLNQLVEGYTRARIAAGIFQKSLLDICVTNSREFGVSLEFTDLSDHCILRCVKNIPRSSSFKEKVTYYD